MATIRRTRSRKTGQVLHQSNNRYVYYVCVNTRRDVHYVVTDKPINNKREIYGHATAVQLAQQGINVKQKMQVLLVCNDQGTVFDDTTWTLPPNDLALIISNCQNQHSAITLDKLITDYCT